MPTLRMDRAFEFADDDEIDGDGCHVVAEARKGVSKGYVASIRPDPADPLGMWLRRFLRPSRASFVARGDGEPRRLLVYARLEPGDYEAHSTLRSRQAHRSAFRVLGAPPRFEVNDPVGAHDNILAYLNGMTPDALLRALRTRPAAPDVLPPLEGTPRQVDWADTIRAMFVERARLAGDRPAEDLVLSVADATWFIANRNRDLADLPAPAPHQFREAPAGRLF